MAKVSDPQDQQQNNPGPDRSGPGYGDSPTSPGSTSYNRGGSPASRVNQPYDSNTGGLNDVRQGESRGAGYKNPNQDQAGNKTEAGGDTNRTDNPKSETPSQLRDDEDQAGDQFASGFDGGSQKSRRQKVKGALKNNKSKLGILSVVGGGSILSVLVALILFVPLKVEHMVQNMQDRFFSAPQTAIENTTRKMAQQYIVKYVIPDYKSCGTTLDRHCKARISTRAGNPVTTLYQTWSNQRLENKLATKYGLEFRYFPHSKQMHVIYRGGPTNGEPIGANGERLSEVLSDPSHKELKQAFDRGLEGELKIKKMYYRFKVGALFKHKFDTKRCIFFCETRKLVEEVKNKPKNWAKLVLAERVLKPRSEIGYVAVLCALSPECHPEHTNPTPCTGGADEDCLPGEPLSDTEIEQRQLLERLGAQYGIEDIDRLVRVHSELSDRGFQRYMTDLILQKVFKTASQETIKKTTDLIPIVGWINLAAELVKMAHEAGPKIQKLQYITYLPAAVSLYQAYRTYADEIHTGQVSADQVGSMVDSLGPGVEDPNDPLVGGTASAEESPIYREIMGSGPLSASQISKNYQCNNGKSPAAGKVCDEERAGVGFGVPNAISGYLDGDGKIITQIAGVWNGTIGAIFNFVDSVGGDVISVAAKPVIAALNVGCLVKVPVPFLPDFYPADRIIPGYCGIKNVAQDAAPKIIEGISKYAIPNPFGSNQGGGRTLTLMAAGADFGGTTACDQLGCQDVPDAVGVKIINDQMAEAKDEFNHQSFSSRMFSADSKFSLISQLAISTPISMRSSAQTTAATLISNPFGTITRSFGAVFASPKSLAATTTECSPFGNDCKAFPDSKIPNDAEDYWDANNCGDTSDNGPIAKWQKKAADGPVSAKTGMPVHDDVEPCLIIKHGTGVGGGIYDKSLLTKDDLAEFNGGKPTSGDFATPTADTGDVYADSSGLNCEGDTKDLGVQTGYHDDKPVKIKVCALPGMPSSSEDSQPGNSLYVNGAEGNVIVNARVSKNFTELVKAAKADGIPMSAQSSFRSMDHQKQLCANDDNGCSSGNYSYVAKPGTSNHQMGVAIDFTMANSNKYPLGHDACVMKNGICTAPGDKVWEWLRKNASKYGFKQYSKEFWHWSPNGK